MNLRLIFLSILLGLNFNASSQIKNGSIAPDFKVTDIHGEEHRLYDLLGEGKNVVLDFFTTWCSPCWDLHQSHVLSDLFKDHSNDFFVLGIEVDERTNYDCLVGNDADCNHRTMGDWTDGTPYPLVENSQVDPDYEVFYYPTVFIVTPERKVYELRENQYGSVKDILVYRDFGPKLTPGINPVLIEKKYDESVCNRFGYSGEKTYSVFNQGTTTIRSADVRFLLNGVIHEAYKWTGTAKPWAAIDDFTFDIEDVYGNIEVEFRLENINGNSDKFLNHTSKILTKASNKIKLKTKGDSNAAVNDNFFTIENNLGETVAFGNINSPGREYEFDFELKDFVCHTFNVWDLGANGILTEIELTDEHGNVIFNNPDFGHHGEAKFNVSRTSDLSETNDSDLIKIFPNPTGEVLNIHFEKELIGDAKVSIRGIDGQLIFNEFFNGNPIDLGEISSGFYFLEIETDEFRVMKKFVKQ